MRLPLHVPLPIGPVTIGFPAFAFLYSAMLSDFVGDYTCAGPGSATDQRPFTATGKATDQGSGRRCAAHGFGGGVLTLLMGLLCWLRPLVFWFGYLLSPGAAPRRRLR